MTSSEATDSDDLDRDVRQAREGDRTALERLVRRSAERIGRLIEHRLGPALRRRVNPSDIFQSAYLQVIRDIDGFEGHDEEAFIGWVGRVIENNIRMKARFFAADKRAIDREVEADSDSWIAAVPTPSREVAQVEELLIVGRALECLPEDYRDVIMMRTVDGLSHEEIALRLGRKSGAVRMLLSRARAALCLEIEKLEQEENGD